ncbi:hypothetical protein OIU79_009550 [Salix purpurea]|uniref:ARM repeat superfamily protein n=1 Tax=Salix purpurea TaxID=77065 RepID=A0A9Q0QDJ9_SALPP|nr:hypothetical protein OIU79_009550 [Salix purpurea]
MWGKDKTTEERRIAICIFDDVAEQCRESALKYYDTYLPFLLEACNDENPDVRQLFSPEALSRLNVVIQHPNAKQPDNVMAYDNAVSALGKICQFHRDSIDSAQFLGFGFGTWYAFTDCQPLRMNSLPYIYRSDREILGPNNQFLPKIVSVFAEVLCGKDLATDKTLGRMANLLRHLQQTLPPATWASTLSVLHPQQQMTLQSILSS